MVKKAYSLETKLACIEMKKSGKPEKVIMDRLGIKNKSQIYTWWRWYQKGETYRFHLNKKSMIGNHRKSPL